MKKKVLKLFISTIILFVLFGFHYAFAITSNQIDTQSSQKIAFIDSALSSVDPGEEVRPDTKTLEIGSKILSAVKLICVGIAIGTIIFTGVMYVTGGPEKLAQIKETLIGLFAGAILIFAPIVIVEILFSTGKTLK